MKYQNLAPISFYHTPVLLEEAVDALQVQPGGRYIDCTVGEGGHSQAILEKSSPGGQLLGIDADPEALKRASVRLQLYGKAALLVNDNFNHLEDICSRYSFRPVNGILFDLGVSSLQLSDKGRGFSFQVDAPLDMRFSPDQELTAADIINTFPEVELAWLIESYGEERRGRRIAQHIVQSRPITTTLQLAGVVEDAIGGVRGRLHPATRTFQALRIAVNQELQYLESALKQAVNVLGFTGRLVVISFHSLEDRVVKQFIRRESRGCLCPPETPVCVCGHTPTLRRITKGIIRPSLAEVAANPRSRSARMRVAEHI